MFEKEKWTWVVAKVCIISNLNESLFYLDICLYINILYFTFQTLSMYSLSNINFKPANVMSCHEMNKQNEEGDGEDDEYEQGNEAPEYVVEDFLQFDSQHKPNLEKTETVNPRDQECVKEVKIIVHLN